MGMELYVQGKRDIIVAKTGMRDVQYMKIYVEHTNSETTKKIIRSDDPYNEYIKHLEKLKEYQDEITLKEWYKDIIKFFKIMIKEMEKQGYEIIYSEI